MLLEWKTSHQGWRWRTSSLLSSSSQIQSIPWLILVVFLQTASVLGSAYPPPIVQQMQGASQSHLTGPSSNIPNYVYQIDGRGDKLVQRQVQQQPLPSGLTAAATNYLLQQLQLEKLQQQQRQLQASDRAGLAAQIAPNSPQAQTLQLLAGLTPQQLAALQAVLPQARAANSQQQHQQPQVASSGSSTAPVIVPAPVGMQQQLHQQQGFSPRMGPFDKIINKAKAWLPEMMGSGSSIGGGSSKSSSSIGEPKMRDMHRLPKPPKYPLYDMGSIGLATPPPAPIMHPMASLPNNAFDWDQASNPSTIPNSSPRSTYNHNQHHHQHQHNWMSPSPTSSTSRRSRPAPRPPKPSKSSFLRNPLGRKPRPSQEPPYSHSNRRNHSPPPPPRGQPPRQRGRNPPPKPQKKGGPPRGRYPPPPRGNRPPPQSGGPTADPYTGGGGGPSGPSGFEHPMASNLSPAQSPSLGRPLSYDEYMARPSHSYTDDPWNFDPFASQMNQGLHTNSLRYNYDPLGMNALDTEANSHLDPNKLSYPGDSFNQDMVKDSPGIGGTAQIGGWDKPYRKRPFGDSEPQSELTPPPGSGASPYSGSSSFSSSPQDPYSPPTSSGRYKNRDSQDRERERERDSSRGSGYVNNGQLSGGRRGDFPMDSHDSESSYRGHGDNNNDRERSRYDGGDTERSRYDGGNTERSRYDSGDRYEGGHRRHHHQQDDAPTIDLETLARQQEEDGMSGLEFTIETSMDKAAAARNEEDSDHDHQPTPHPLGPMQPASDPFLSDQYNPYGEHSAPAESTIPGTPYGPNGFRERYGRRKTRNNHNGSTSATARTSSQRYRARARAYYQHKRQQQQQQRAAAAAAVAEKRTAPVSSSSATAVPEGVQIFNDIIRPQLQLTSSSSSSSTSTTGGSSSSRYGGQQRRAQVHPNQEALRRSLYNAIRQQAASSNK